MRKTLLTKSLSLFTSLALVISALPAYALGPVAVSVPDFVKTLTPPSQLGYVDTYYQGNTEKPVILIQDLHANYGVQKKIEGLLSYYQPQLTVGGHPMVLGIEGAWGKLDLSQIRKVTEKVRRAASDFLLKEAEISGMEHFAALSPTPIDFYGIDNPEDYFIHRELFRKSLAARLELAGKIDTLRQAVNGAKADGSSDLRHIWKLADDFHAGRIGLEELSRDLNIAPLADYGQAEVALAQAQTISTNKEKGDKAFYMKNVVLADRDLELLARLFRQQLTLEEVQYVAKQVPQMLMVIQALLLGENMQLWQDTVRSAIDHYAVALLRNKPMSAHAEDLVSQYPGVSPVIVTGGFHTAGIAEDFKVKKISYVIIAPVVEGQTAHDERLYLKRMMGLHVTDTQISDAARAYARHSDTVSTLTDMVSWAMAKAGAVRTTTVQNEVATLNRTLTAFENGATAADVARTVVPADTEEAKVAATIDAEVQPEDAIQAPSGLLGMIGATLSNLKIKLGIGASKAIPVDTVAENATDVVLDPASATPTVSKSTSLGSKIGYATSVVAVMAVLAKVSVANVAQNAVNHPTAKQLTNPANSSHPLALAIGTVAVLGASAFGAAYKLSPNFKKKVDDTRQKIYEKAINGAA